MLCGDGFDPRNTGELWPQILLFWWTSTCMMIHLSLWTGNPDSLPSFLPFQVLRMTLLHVKEEILASVIFLLYKCLLLNTTGSVLLMFHYGGIFLTPGVTWTYPSTNVFTPVLSIGSTSFITDLDSILLPFFFFFSPSMEALRIRAHLHIASLDLWLRLSLQVKTSVPSFGIQEQPLSSSGLLLLWLMSDLCGYVLDPMIGTHATPYSSLIIKWSNKWINVENSISTLL